MSWVGSILHEPYAANSSGPAGPTLARTEPKSVLAAGVPTLGSSQGCGPDHNHTVHFVSSFSPLLPASLLRNYVLACVVGDRHHAHLSLLKLEPITGTRHMEIKVAGKVSWRTSLVVQWLSICLLTGITSSIPCLGRFNMLQGNLARVLQLLCSATREATAMRSPCTSARESSRRATKTQHS